LLSVKAHAVLPIIYKSLWWCTRDRAYSIWSWIADVIAYKVLRMVCSCELDLDEQHMIDRHVNANNHRTKSNFFYQSYMLITKPKFPILPKIAPIWK